MKRSELRMPRTEGRPDDLGIRYEGPVLNGETSVEFYQRQVAEQALMFTNGTRSLSMESVRVGNPDDWMPSRRRRRTGKKP